MDAKEQRMRHPDRLEGRSGSVRALCLLTDGRLASGLR
jgi:hypothetical protein